MASRLPDLRSPEHDRIRPLWIVVRPGAREGFLATAMRCLGRLVPRARLVVAPTSPPREADTEVIVLDAEEIAAGPLTAATALARERRKG
jgi:Na+-transporting methylmalonyl-CoA/oxaloacetate decarboxylase gamma subunit